MSIFINGSPTRMDRVFINKDRKERVYANGNASSNIVHQQFVGSWEQKIVIGDAVGFVVEVEGLGLSGVQCALRAFGDNIVRITTPMTVSYLGVFSGETRGTSEPTDIGDSWAGMRAANGGIQIGFRYSGDDPGVIHWTPTLAFDYLTGFANTSVTVASTSGFEQIWMKGVGFGIQIRFKHGSTTSPYSATLLLS